jgi:hypothetical protein
MRRGRLWLRWIAQAPDCGIANQRAGSIYGASSTLFFQQRAQLGPGFNHKQISTADLWIVVSMDSLTLGTFAFHLALGIDSDLVP